MKKKLFVGIILLACAALLLGGALLGGFLIREHQLNLIYEQANAELAAKEGQYNEERILLQDTDAKRAADLARRLGAGLRITANGEFAVLTLPEGMTISDVYRDRKNRSLLADMTPDYHVYLTDTDVTEDEEDDILNRPDYQVSDPDYVWQSYLDYLQIEDSWNTTMGIRPDGDRVVVAIVDTGIDTDHPEFFRADGQSLISPESYNASEDKVVSLYNDMTLIEDTVGHGTAVAGVIAAQMNAVGTVGISPDVELLIIKCEVDESGAFTSSSDIIFALYYAVERDVDVINLSLGGNMNIFQQAIQLAVDSDIIPVAAAGNSQTNQPVYPAADPNTIGVGALDSDSWTLADYSNYGVNSDIVAPGTVYTTTLNGGYGTYQGTSLSAPMVSAGIALYLSQNPYTEFSTVKAMVEAAGLDLGDLGNDELYGYGCLDIHALLLEEKGSITYDYGTEELSSTSQIFIRQHTIQVVPEPERENLVFDDWYFDKAYTKVFDYETYFSTAFVEDVTLYAKWSNEDDEEDTAFQYKTLSDGTVEITGYKGKRRYLIIPDTLDGKTVSAIGSQVFAKNKRLRMITLPEGLLHIGNEAFSGATSLSKVQWSGYSLLSIGKNAFQGCTSLKSIDLPNSVQMLGEGAFSECTSLRSIYITPESALTEVGAYALSQTGIYDIYIPKYAYMDGSVFLGCTSLRTVTVHPNNALLKVVGKSLYTADGQSLLYHPAALTGDFVVESGVTAIGNYAFAFSNISSIELNRVVSIGAQAFSNTSRLTEMTLPDTVTTMGVGAFQLSGIKSIRLSENLTDLPDNAFYATGLTAIHIPGRVQTIGNTAFRSCSYMRSVTFGEDSNLVAIGQNAFSSCRLLNNLSLPESLREIGVSAFASCSSLTEITLPSGLRALGAEAFNYCSQLTKVVFDGNCQLATIPESCFMRCDALTEVTFSDEIRVIAGQAFSYCASLTTLNFGADSRLLSVGDYAFHGCSALTAMQIPGTVESIGQFAYAFSGLTAVHLTESMTQIGVGAFGACFELSQMTADAANPVYKTVNNVLYDKAVTTVYCVPASHSGTFTLPETVTVTAPYSFYYDVYITRVNLPEGLEDIRQNSFFHCESLETIDIPYGVFNIGREAFSYCYELEAVTFSQGSSLQRLGYRTFVSCGLKSFTVPASVTQMAQYVFRDCDDLTRITFAENSRLSYIAAYMFMGCDSLKEIVFEKGSALTMLQAQALSGLTSLKSIDFGDAQVTDIDNYAFYDCASLEKITLPSTLTYIGRYAFYGCRSITRMDIPAQVTYIGANAFNNTDHARIFFATETLPYYAQADWDAGIAGYFLSAKDYVVNEEWEYVITYTDTAAIILYKGGAQAVNVDTVDGYPVTKVGARAFFGQSQLTHVILADTVTEIGNHAFAGCSNMQNLTVPASVRIIGNYAFANTGITVSLAQDSRLEEIGVSAFEHNVTAALMLPDTVHTIGDRAFYGSDLTTLTITSTSSLTHIGKEAFAESSLTEIFLPASLKAVGDAAFRYTRDLKNVTFADGDTPLKIGNSAFRGSGLTAVSLPERVNYIGEYAFGSCTSLQSIEVDARNQSYTSREGILCDSTGAVIIQYPSGRKGAYEVPADVCVLTYASFKDAVGLTRVTFAPGSTVRTIGCEVFSGCTALTAMDIPDSVISVDQDAFRGCIGLKTVTFGENSSLATINGYAFFDCRGLELVHLPESLVDIGEYAFGDCVSLVAFTGGENLRSIAAHAFDGCTSLSQIPDLPNLTVVEDYAFAKTAVTEYTLPPKVNIIDHTVFHNSHLNAIYTDPENPYFVSIDGVLYDATAQGADLEAMVIWPAARIYVVGEGKTTVTSDDTEIIRLGLVGDNWVLADSVTVIGTYAFRNCTTITTLTVPEQIVRMENYAFAGCTNLTEIHYNAIVAENMKEQWSYSENHVFDDAGMLSGGVHVMIGSRVKAIPDALFYPSSRNDNLHIVSLTFQEGSVCAYIGEDAFRDCRDLPYVLLPPCVNIIGHNAFGGDCSAAIGFESDKLPAELGAFWNGNGSYALNIREIHEADGGIYAIARDEHVILMSYRRDDAIITIPDSFLGVPVTEIAADIFAENETLVSIILPETLTTIGTKAFYSCDRLTSVCIPPSVTYIGDQAFGHCYNLELIEYRAVDAVTSGKYVDNIFTQVGRDAEKCRLILGAEARKIPDYLFYGTDITHVELEKGSALSFVGAQAFCYSDRITEVSIADLADWCKIDFAIKDSSPLVYAGTLRVDGTPLTALAIPREITELGDFAFAGLTSLKSVDFGDTLTHIGKGGFYGCTGLTELNIPSTVITVGDNAFTDCSGLTSVYWNTPHPDAVKEAFRGIGQPGGQVTATIGAQVDMVPQGLFSYSRNLTSVIFEEGGICTAIGEDAFSYCPVLTGIRLPETLTSIGKSAFYDCDGLTEIVIPDGVETVGNGAFSLCGQLKEITLGRGIKTLGRYAFYNTVSLEKIHFNAVSMEDMKGITRAFIGAGTQGNGIIMTVGSQVTRIPNYLFDHMAGDPLHVLREVYFEANSQCASVGTYAFEGCEELLIAFSDAEAGGNIYDSMHRNGNPCITNVKEILHGDKITYALCHDGTVSVGRYYGDAAEINLSSPVENAPLTRIGANAFKEISSLTRVTMPDTVTDIDQFAFVDCDHLVSVELSEQLLRVGKYAFNRCASLKEINLPDTLIFIGSHAFSGCASLEEVTLPKNLETLESMAFANCSGLKTVYYEAIALGDTQGNIFFESAYRENGITVYVHKQVTRIPSYLFNTFDGEYYYSNIRRVVFEEGSACQSIGEKAFEGCDSLTDILLPEGLKTIEKDAFRNLPMLNVLLVPASVTRMESVEWTTVLAFRGDVLPDLGSNYAIEVPYALNIKEAIVDDYVYLVTHDNTVVIGRALEDPQTVVIPSSYRNMAVTSIAPYAFSRRSMVNLTIPESITYLGEKAFIYCYQLENVYYNAVNAATHPQFHDVFSVAGMNGAGISFHVGEKVREIPEQLFYNQAYLTSVSFAENSACRIIGKFSFAGCSALAQVTLPQGLTHIGDGAFASCSALKEIIIPTSVTTIGESAFGNCGNLLIGFVAGELPEHLDENWGRDIPYYLNTIGFETGEDALYVVQTDGSVILGKYGGNAAVFTLPGEINGRKVTGIGKNAFKSKRGLTRIVISSGITYIDDYAFSDCWALASVTLPDTLTSIGAYAFNGCSALAEIQCPDSLKTIGEHAFYYNSALSRVTLNRGLISIEASTFEGCGKLEEIVFPDSLSEIGARAFNGCSSLKTIVLPDSLVTVGSRAFANCSSATSVTVGSGVLSLGSYAFAFCPAVENLYFNAVSMRDFGLSDTVFGSLGQNSPNGVAVHIGSQVFRIPNAFLYSYSYPTAVTSITFASDSVCEEIGQSAFKNLERLTEITLPAHLRVLNDNAFSGCSALTEVVIPENVTRMGSYLFSQCGALERVVIGNNVTAIEYNTFDSCSRLSSVIIGEGVSRIDAGAFNRCSSLKELYLPAACATLGSQAFYGCDQLSVVYIHNSRPASNLYSPPASGYLTNYVTTIAIPTELGDFGLSFFPYKTTVTYNGQTYTLYAKHEHTWVETETARVDCHTPGFSGLICSECGVKNGTDTGSHLWTPYKVAGTCQQAGFEGYICSDCGLSRGIPVFGHAFDEGRVIPPTCFDGGYTLYTCSECGYQRRTAYTSATGHLYGEWILSKAPTCIDYGEQYRVCEGCGDLSTGSVPLLGHAYGDWYETLTPTCTETGERRKDCQRCDVYVTEPLPTRHNYGDGVNCIYCGAAQPMISQWDVSADGDGSVMASLYEINANESYRLVLTGSGAMKGWTGSMNAIPWYQNYRLYITRVEVGEGITSIGKNAFWGCEKLTVVKLASSITYIGDSAFSSCYALSEVSLPHGLTELGGSAFYGCRALTEIVIPNGVTKMGNSVFSNCTSLRSVEIGEGMITIGNYAFYGCTAVETFVIRAKALADFTASHSAFTQLGKDGKGVTVIIGNRVTRIPANLFSPYMNDREYAPKVVSVIFEEGSVCTEIATRAFFRNSLLTGIFIPASVNTIGSQAFTECSSLKVFFESETLPASLAYDWFYGGQYYLGVYKILYTDQGIYLLSRDNKATLIQYTGTETHVVLPESVEGYSLVGIAAHAFENRTDLQSIVFPKTLVSIGEYAFSGCSGLTALTLPESLKTIGAYAFDGCSHVTELRILSVALDSLEMYGKTFNRLGAEGPGVHVVIGQQVTVIPDCMFYVYVTSSYYDRAPKILDVTFEENSVCTRIGYQAFYGCSDLRTVVLGEKLSDFGGRAFGDCSSLICAYVKSPEQAKAVTYNNDWGDLAGWARSVAFAEGITELGQYVYNHFRYCETMIVDGITYTVYADHAHDWSLIRMISQQIPCMQDGVGLYVCLTCGVSCERVVPAHEESDWIVTEEATCTSDGQRHTVCQVCGEMLRQETIPMTGHTLTQYPGQAPTCQEAGWQPYEACALCDYSTYQPMPANGHTPDSQATCTSGVRCVVCLALLEDALGHQYEVTVTKPTCTDRGYTTHTCQRCGKIRQTDFVPPTGHRANGEADCVNDSICLACGTVLAEKWGHSYETRVILPTCTEEGYSIYTCTRCAYSYEGDRRQALGHNPGSPATCTTAQTCKTCHAVLTEALGHQYREGTLAPTCTTGGYTIFTCSVCRYQYKGAYTEPKGHTPSPEPDCERYQYCLDCRAMLQEALGHDFTIRVVEPTCTQGGYTEHTCTRCDTQRIENRTQPTGHTPEGVADCTHDQICRVCGEITEKRKGHVYGIWIYEPDCVTQGFTRNTCVRCGDSYDDSFVPPKGHRPGNEVGCITDQTCLDCGTVLVSALGHEYMEVIHEPTCTSTGSVSQVCRRCSYGFTVSTLPVKPHTPGEPADCTKNQYCLDCGLVLDLMRPHRHEGVITPPTCTEAGYVTYTCVGCGDTYEVEWEPATGHIPGASATCTENQICTACGVVLAEKWGHSYTVTVVPPTCVNEGYTLHTCTTCGEGLVLDPLPALPHTPGEEADCDNPQSCLNCGTILQPALGHLSSGAASCTEDEICLRCLEVIGIHTGHSYVMEIVRPTCEVGGYTRYVCETCDDTYDDDFVLPLGHSPNVPTACEEVQYCIRCSEVLDDRVGHDDVIETRQPTCTESGYTKRTCRRCHRVETVEVYPATGHTPDREADCTHDQICITCGCLMIEKSGHDYETVVIDPTCIMDGYTLSTCLRCGDTLVTDKITAPGHRADREANCTHESRCIRCDTILAPAFGHSYQAEEVPPTCTEEGYTNHVCTRCDHAYKDHILPATGHTVPEYTPCTQPVCCTDCGEVLYPRGDHDYETTVVSPTCTEGGYLLHACGICGEQYTDTPTDPLGHSPCENASCLEAVLCLVCGEQLAPRGDHAYETTAVPPTCTEGGYLLHACGICGEQYTDTPTDPLGHSPDGEPDCTRDQHCLLCGVLLADKREHMYEATVVAPTCTEGGYTVHVCGFCGDSYTDTPTEPIDHSPVGAADCTHDQVCEYCGKILMEHTGHVYEDFVYEPTCTEQGFTWHSCTVCYHNAYDSYTPPKGHIPGKPADCENPQTCENCDFVFAERIPHEYQDEVVPPTCVDAGYTKHTCVMCGVSYQNTYVTSKGHTPGEDVVVTPPTCTQGGWTTYTCVDCHQQYDGLFTGPAGHFAPYEADCDTDRVCQKCGILLEEKLGHHYGDLKVVEATCTEDGYTAVICTRCGDLVYRDQIPALGHKEGDWIITVQPQPGVEGYRYRVCTVCSQVTAEEVMEALPGEPGTLPETDPETEKPTEPQETEPSETEPETEPQETEPSETQSETQHHSESTSGFVPDVTDPAQETEQTSEPEEATSAPESKKGCGGSIGSVLSILLLTMAAVTLLWAKKRKEQA